MIVSLCLQRSGFETINWLDGPSVNVLMRHKVCLNITPHLFQFLVLCVCEVLLRFTPIAVEQKDNHCLPISIPRQSKICKFLPGTGIKRDGASIFSNYIFLNYQFTPQYIFVKAYVPLISIHPLDGYVKTRSPIFGKSSLMPVLLHFTFIIITNRLQCGLPKQWKIENGSHSRFYPQ